jgi:hypothetical protein
MWLLLLCVCVAGAIGGVVNALMTDNGFILPAKVTTDAANIVRPGFFGNILFGFVAAGISWGLYGPLSGYVIFGTAGALAKNVEESLGISLASLVGAVLVGIGGARWLTNEVDKKLLKAAATTAAASQPNQATAQQIALASPAQALNIAKAMPKPPAQ